jgi:hypothetical protein
MIIASDPRSARSAARTRGGASRCAAWLALVVTSACSSPSIGLDELEAADQDARCARLVHCGLFAAADACDAYFRKPPPSSFGPAKTAGRLEFDGGSAKLCEDALAAQGCDPTARDARVVPEPCLAMFRGRVTDGDPCSFDQECASSRCELPVCDEGVCCVGRCGPTRPRGHAGDACDRSSECIDGYCDTDHTCHALGAAAASCARDEQCGYGLACLQASPSLPGSCGALPRLGELCPYRRCAELDTTCDASMRCVKLGLPGAPCMAHGDCSPFAECDMTRHACVELPTLGEPCDVACAGEAWCDRETQPAAPICNAPQPNGTPCDEADKCATQSCKPGPVFASCQDYPICF